jgi:hypothetical protein
VAVEQLDHAAGLSGAVHPLVEARHVERVDQPDPAVDHQRMRGPRPRLAHAPSEAAVELVHPAHVHGQDGSVIV